MADFYQIMWRSKGYFSPGSYFRTADEGIERLQEDAKDREKRLSFHRGELETRTFGKDDRDEIVIAKQVDASTMRTLKLKVVVLEDYKEK